VRIPSVAGTEQEGHQRVEGGQSPIDLALITTNMDGTPSDGRPLEPVAWLVRRGGDRRRLAPGAFGGPESNSGFAPVHTISPFTEFEPRPSRYWR
jgi:hypothetical protein